MNSPAQDWIDDYLDATGNWNSDREAAVRRDLRIAWIVAGILGGIAVCEAAALVALAPLKTVVPYTLMVDRHTGYVEALRPLERQTVAPDTALTRSFLAQYVLTREGFDINSLQNDYRRVALWTSGEARDQYIAAMQASNPDSPLARLPRRAVLAAEIRAISSLGPHTALVRFDTRRTDQGLSDAATPWQAIVTYRFSGEEMSAADRLTNPLGFQVTRYRRNMEIAPQDVPAPTAGLGPLLAPPSQPTRAWVGGEPRPVTASSGQTPMAIRAPTR